MGATSQRSFKFLQSVYNDLQDFSEFDQVSYIKEALHSNESGQSKYHEGVCASLCIYVICDWILNGTRRKPVDQLVLDCNDLNSSHPSLVPVESFSHALDEGEVKARDYIVEAIKKTTKKSPKSPYMEITAGKAINETNRHGQTFMAWGGLADVGHAIICDGRSCTVFDPNYGYFQTKQSSAYLSVFRKLTDNYPGYKESAGVTIFPY